MPNVTRTFLTDVANALIPSKKLRLNNKSNMKKTILFMLIAATLDTTAQDKSKTIADETTVTDMKSSTKIETTNETVFKRILGTFEGKLFRYMVTLKKDRKGPYKEYTLYFKPEDKETIVTTIQKF